MKPVFAAKTEELKIDKVRMVVSSDLQKTVSENHEQFMPVWAFRWHRGNTNHHEVNAGNGVTEQLRKEFGTQE